MMWLLSNIALAVVPGTVIVGGDWAGANLIVQDGDILEGTFTNVGSFIVPDGVTAKVQQGIVLEVHATEIEIDGVLDGVGSGELGGGGGDEGAGVAEGKPGAGDAGGRGGPTKNGYGGGGGGGGHGGKGGQGGMYYGGEDPAGGGLIVGQEDGRFEPILLGSGGGGGGGYAGTIGGQEAKGGRGGNGGGGIYLLADTIEINGSVLADGGNGPTAPGYISSGGGGGAGGTVVIDGGDVFGYGTLSARGGRGGDAYQTVQSIQAGGGGGGGGRIKVFYGGLSGKFVTLVNGGEAGENGLPNSTYAEDPKRGGDGSMWTELTDPDVDLDGVLVPGDNCPVDPNPDQLDADGDGIGDACDDCPLDAFDTDEDGVCDQVDRCLGGDDALDADQDGQPDACDCAPEDANQQTNGIELCDGLDNNCDDVIDPSGSAGSSTYFIDLDGDGFGRFEINEYACAPSLNFVEVGGDCADDVFAVNPGGAEFCDGIDNDCDGLIDQACADIPEALPSSCGCQSDGSGAATGLALFAGALVLARRRRATVG